jgi:hypothetical protein
MTLCEKWPIFVGLESLPAVLGIGPYSTGGQGHPTTPHQQPLKYPPGQNADFTNQIRQISYTYPILYLEESEMSRPYDPWQKVRTRHNFAADEVISALQKEIRRGNTENAVLLAYEMATTSPDLEAYLWKRLEVISVEDIGWGELQAPVLIHALREAVNGMDQTDGERLLFAVHAVRYLCACKKDRSSDEMVNWVIESVESGQRLPAIPDYALDMHTKRGQELGRDVRHFWEVGAQLNPELPGRDTTYRDRVVKTLKETSG